MDNLCLDAEASATASSVHSPDHPASAVIDGDRTGRKYGQGGVWLSEVSEGEHAVTIDLGRQHGPVAIAQVNVYTLADDWPTVPSPDGQTRAQDFAIEDFRVEILSAEGVVVDAKVIVGNVVAMRKVMFEDCPHGNAVRVVVTKARENQAAITEIEAYSRAA